MTTSVVIPSYKGIAYLQKNLPVVLALKTDQVIVVDDASPDETSEFLAKNFPQVHVVKHEINTRFPKSVNDGFAAATSDIVILLNQDVTPDAGLLKNTIALFSDPLVFAVTFNEGKRSWAKAKFIRGFIEFTNGDLDTQTHESFWASGGSAAFRRQTWEELGGFDVNYNPGYFEDLDLGYRAHKRGYSIVWNPKAKVAHEVESTISKLFDPAYLRRAKERNYLLSHWKNLSGGNLLTHLGFLLVRILGRPGYIVPVGMALLFLPDVVLFRLRETRTRSVSDETIFAKFN